MICWLKPVPHLGYEAQLTSRHPVFRHTSLKVWSKEHRSAWELLGPLLDFLGHSLIFMRPVCTQVHYSLKTWTYPLYVPIIDGCTPNKQRCARKCGIDQVLIPEELKVRERAYCDSVWRTSSRHTQVTLGPRTKCTSCL